MPALMANPSVGAAGRPQPQTPTGGSGGPWIRYARSATRPGYALSGVTFGSGPITNPLPSAPGYVRRFPLLVAAVAGGGVAAVAAADAPWNLFNPIQLKDPWGTPLITGTGYELLFLAAKYSGQLGVIGAADRSSLPSFSAIATSGNFTFTTGIPVEGTKGYGVISIGNASVMPTILLQPTTSATVYSTLPTTVPTLNIFVDEEFYDIDPANPVVPIGNGTTFQMVVVQGNQTVGLGSSTRVQLPRTGGYLTALVEVIRDQGASNARVDGFSAGTNPTGQNRIRTYVDGVPRFDDTGLQLFDRMFEDYQTSRPTGVIAYNFKDSLGRIQLGLLDTLETAMQTNPGTLVETEMTPWASTGTGPYQLNALQIQVVPAGVLAQGLVEQ